MFRFVALFALVAVAVAEPEAKAEADAQFYGMPYAYGGYGVHPSHATVGAQVYANGAVVPQDTLSVKAAKAQHFTAKANEYAKKGYGMPVYGATYGLNPFVHAIGKREAEADSQFYGYGMSPYYNRAAYTTGFTGYPAYTTAGYTGYALPHASYVHSIGKREAEADSQFYGYGMSPYYNTAAYTTGYGYSGFPGVTAGYTGYALPAASYVHSIGKREAESDSYYPYSAGYASYAPYSSYGYGNYRSAYSGYSGYPAYNYARYHY